MAMTIRDARASLRPVQQLVETVTQFLLAFTVE
jgi:hypothetical protein